MFEDQKDINLNTNSDTSISKNDLIDDFEIVDKNSASNSLQNNSNFIDISNTKPQIDDSVMVDDMFSKTDIVNPSSIIKPGSTSPKEPITNYKEFIREVDNVQTNKIKPLYFLVGVVILVIILGLSGLWAYKKFFVGKNDSGEIILNTKTDTSTNNTIANDNQLSEDLQNNANSNINSTNAITDSDGDGLSDEDETNKYQTDSKNVDSDSDGLSDKEEVLIYKTDPKNPDTDGDGYQDGKEIDNGYDPKGPGKLFDMSLITGNSEEKQLVSPDIDTSSWKYFSSVSNDKKLNFGEFIKTKIDFKYPADYNVENLNGRVFLSPKDKSFSVEIDIRDNKLELDFIDWLLTQKDYPKFNQENTKLNNYDAFVVTSDDANWKAKNSIFINNVDKVYNFNYLGNITDSNFKIFQSIISSFNIK